MSELTYMSEFPTPLGIIYEAEQDTYEDKLYRQLDHAVEVQGKGDLKSLLHSGHTWTVS